MSAAGAIPVVAGAERGKAASPFGVLSCSATAAPASSSTATAPPRTWDLRIAVLLLSWRLDGALGALVPA
jgi:hypothetical protein